MSVQTNLIFQEVTGITSSNDDTAAKQININPKASPYTVAAITTGSAPSTGAKFQFSLDGTNWVNEGNNATVNFANAALGPAAAVRLAVTDGTWTLQVRQALNSDIAG